MHSVVVNASSFGFFAQPTRLVDNLLSRLEFNALDNSSNSSKGTETHTMYAFMDVHVHTYPLRLQY